MEERKVPQIFDKHRRAARWKRAEALSQGEDRADFLREDMHEEVLERLDFLRLRDGHALLLGALRL